MKEIFHFGKSLSFCFWRVCQCSRISFLNGREIGNYRVVGSRFIEVGSASWCYFFEAGRPLTSFIVLYFFEKPRQILVNFFVHSRKMKPMLWRIVLPFSASWIAISSLLACHLWLLALPFVAFEPLICHKWEPQSIALTTPKHSFNKLERCKENGKHW